MMIDAPLKRIFFFCFLLVLCLAAGAGVAPTTSPNNLYSNAGTANFDTTPYYNTATTTVSPAIFSIAFVRSQTTTNYRFGFSIQSINYQITNNKLNYTVIPTGSNTAASAQLALYTNNANKISLLKIGYIIIQPLFSTYYFSYRLITPNRNFITNTASSYTEASVTDGPFNTSKTYTLWITILGVDASLANNNQIDLYPSASVTGPTSITYKIQTISPTQFYLSSIVMMAFIYDNTELQSLNRNALLTVSNVWNTNTNSLSATDSSSSVRSFNTLVGILGFHIANIGYLQFTLTITPNNAMGLSTTYSFNYISFNYLIARFTYCAPATPYLIVSTRLCYDVCPIRYVTDSLYFQCNSCPTYDCYYCGANGLCTQCSSAVDFRTMDTTTNRCVPLDGYYDDGSHSQAMPCDPIACLTCTSLTFCLSCQTGKYLSASNSCLNCIENCFKCTDGISCVIYLTTNKTCFLNCSTITNCLTCSYSTSLTCNSCAVGYQPTANICNSVCGDGNRVADESCDDGNTVNGDGCTSACKVQSHFFCADTANGIKILSVCKACSSNCNTCTNASYCTVCSAGYTLLADITCFINCSTITNCMTCSYSTSLNCNSCATGYQLSSNSCNSVCGDGNRVTDEICDDGNTANGDGCSSTCKLQAHYFCADTTNGAKILSLCAQCSSNCNTCTNASYCSVCYTGYTLLSNNTCFLNCSTITNCLTCSYSSSLTCNTCANAFQLTGNTCISVCGDGNRASDEGCDDGNLDNADGCSSTCKVQLYYFCLDTNVSNKILSVCGKCQTHCDSCLNASYCSSCSSGYSISVNGITASCNQSCTPNCNLCINQICIGCKAGFLLNSPSKCNPVCGDGLILATQGCDDGNMENGDGCSNVCQIQSNFACTANSNGTSVCSLTSLAIEFQSATKDEFSNSLTLLYKIIPSTVNALKTLDWSAITSQASNLSLNLTQFSYDASTGNLKINVHYRQILSDRNLALQFAFPNSAPFSQLGTKSTSVTLSASNNLSLWFYDTMEYKAAHILKFVALGLTAFSLFLFVLGYYSGKLIALQLLAIFQLTYFSLLSVQNLSPGFTSLKNLSYTNGFSIPIFTSTKLTDKLFSFLNFDFVLFNNFNLNFALLLLPLFLALIAGIISTKTQTQATAQKPKTSLSRLLCGQLVLYGIMFFLNSLVFPMMIILKNIMHLGLVQLGCLLGGVVILLLIFIYDCLLRKFPQYFGQFVELIDSSKTIHFYYFLQLQRVVISCLLVFLVSWKYQIFTIIGTLIIKLLLLTKMKPYKSNGGNLRPFLNTLTQIMIMAVFSLYPIIGTKIFEYHYYAPFFIVGHLAVAVAYNFYFFVKAVKKRCKQRSRQAKIGDFQPYDERDPWKNMWMYAKGQQSVSKIL